MAGIVAVGVDDSDGSRRALEWAAEEARIRGARLRPVLAWSYLEQPEGKFDAAYGEDDALRNLDRFLEAAGVDLGELDVERRVICDLPARALLEAAKDADLLVVGSRGSGGFKGLLLGSVSQQVVQHAPCPVTVVPHAERAAGSA
jgi:nucleotide-binding universal stress UspA family protein